MPWLLLIRGNGVIRSIGKGVLATRRRGDAGFIVLHHSGHLFRGSFLLPDELARRGRWRQEPIDRACPWRRDDICCLRQSLAVIGAIRASGAGKFHPPNSAAR